VKRTQLLVAVALVASLLGLVMHAGPASAAPVVQPGVSLLFGGNAFCTMNWVYDGSGGPYVGAAAHCASGVGEEVDLATGSLGSAVERIGHVAFVSSGLDYCLIAVDPGIVPQLNPAMAGHPNIPTGVSTPSTAHLGDLIQFSGHGIGFDLLSLTQQGRVGVFNFFSNGNQYVIGPVTPGDSGGPVADLTDGGKAIGIVDTVGVTLALPLANVGEGGAALYAVLQDAATHGLSLTLRTV
jgi:hypothetical protein